MKKNKWLGLLVVCLIVSCDNQTYYIPKPPTFLELNLPKRNYEIYKDSCGYTFNKPDYFEVKLSGENCNRDIDFNTLNGTLFISRIDMDTSLSVYVNYALDKMDDHKIKATGILDSTIIRKEDRVFGTFFELQGNVASPLQFYLTDSTSRFINGLVYFNVRPNYDSIKPVLNFVKKDILELMNTLKWD